MYRKNAWEKYNEQQMQDVMSFGEGYKQFISEGKTERLCVKLTVEMAEAKGFRNLEEIIKNNEELKVGDKVYALNMGKNIALFVIGEKPMEEALRELALLEDEAVFNGLEKAGIKGLKAYGEERAY